MPHGHMASSFPPPPRSRELISPPPLPPPLSLGFPAAAPTARCSAPAAAPRAALRWERCPAGRPWFGHGSKCTYPIPIPTKIGSKMGAEMVPLVLTHSRFESQSKPGTKIGYPAPGKELGRRLQLFLAGTAPYQPF